MFEEDALLDEQIRKKKRFVLLALFTLLLLVTLSALTLISPTPSSPQAVAELETSRPTEPLPPTPSNQATVTLAPTAEVTPTPQATTTVSLKIKTPSAVATKSPDEIQGDEWQEPATPPTSGANDTSEAVTTPAATLTGEGQPGLAENTPSSTPEGGDISVTLTPGAGQPAATVAVESTIFLPEDESLDLNELPRVHEIWNPTGEKETVSGGDVPLASTPGLTSTLTISETELMIPPNGLPVTGAVLHPGVNWAAVAVVLLLLGAGVAALHRPGSGRS